MELNEPRLTTDSYPVRVASHKWKWWHEEGFEL